VLPVPFDFIGEQGPELFIGFPELHENGEIGDGTADVPGFDAVFHPRGRDKKGPRFQRVLAAAIEKASVPPQEIVDFVFPVAVIVIAAVPVDVFGLLEVIHEHRVLDKHISILCMFYQSCLCE
jgi:hypothetical protein